MPDGGLQRGARVARVEAGDAGTPAAEDRQELQDPYCQRCRTPIPPNCPQCHRDQPFRDYIYSTDYELRIVEGSLAGLLAERYHSIPRTTIAIFVFFFCTGFQYMVLQLTKTPEECYENLKCETWPRRYNVKNWNAVLSNIVYLIVGFFLLLYIADQARKREVQYKRKTSNLRAPASIDAGRGPELVKVTLCHNKAQSGLAINACLSLICEGFLSGLYHACPTQKNSQFDYIGITMVAVSFFLMVWSKRHPIGISSGAYAVFFAFICFVITLDNVGNMTKRKEFQDAAWALTLTAWGVGTPRYLMLLHFGLPNLLPGKKEWQLLQQYRTSRTARRSALEHKAFYSYIFVWLVGFGPLCMFFLQGELLSRTVMLLSCAMLGLYTLIHLGCLCMESRTSTQAAALPLAITDGAGVSANTSWAARLLEDAAATYRAPTVEEERRTNVVDVGPPSRTVPIVASVVLTVAFGLCGGFFFSQDVYSTKLSMQESAAKNRPCLLFDFFDNHDVWHLFSGLALGSYILASLLLDGSESQQADDAQQLRQRWVF